jgi:pimeloyl-ACP methyl ester carboxylesterase
MTCATLLRMTRLLLSLSMFGLWPTAFSQEPTSDLAASWRASGSYFSWQSSLPENHGKSVQVFYACLGDATKPAMLLLHGFPTSSFDYRLLSHELEGDFRLCMFDFPGYGFSDKPSGDYHYSLKDDADLTWYFVTKVVSLREFVLLSHDRGDSVALGFLELYQAAANPPFRITHQFILNGNMYLPLANLTDFQKRMLDPTTSATLVKTVTPALIAGGMGSSTFTPPLKPDDPTVRAMAAIFAYQSGVEVLPATIQYLNERKKMEVSYLQVLAKSPVPVTLIWGVHDTIAPVRVADYVWNTAILTRKVPGAYWIVPCGNHYVQHDQPQAVARIVRLAFSNPRQTAPYNLSADACAPVLIGREQPQQ